MILKFWGMILDLRMCYTANIGEIMKSFHNRSNLPEVRSQLVKTCFLEQAGTRNAFAHESWSETDVSRAVAVETRSIEGRSVRLKGYQQKSDDYGTDLSLSGSWARFSTHVFSKCIFIDVFHQVKPLLN